jgi:hypothetical protein
MQCERNGARKLSSMESGKQMSKRVSNKIDKNRVANN